MSTVIYRLQVEGFGEAKQDLEFLTTQTKKLNTEKQRLNQQHTAAARAITAETGSMEELRAKTALLRAQANQMRVTNEQEARARAQVIQKVRENTMVIRDHDRAMSGSSTLVGEYSRGILTSFKRIGGAVLGLGGSVMIVLKLVQAFVSAIKTGVEFEAAMSNVKAVSQATDEAFNKLRASAIALGGSTKFTASQVSSLQFELAKLGFTSSEILNMTAGILDLAAATGVDLAEAATIAGSTLRQFGLDSTEMSRAVDVMTKVLAISALDISSFGTAMAIAGPVAATVGETIEETSAKLAVLANRGLDASMSGTSLRNVYLELQKQGLTWNEAMDKISGSQNKATTSLEMFGKRAAVAGLILAANTEETEGFTGALNDATGTARDMATTMQDNVAGSVIKLQSAWEGLTLRINQTNGALKWFIDGMTTVVAGLGTKGFVNQQQLFDDAPITNFNDKFMFFISLGHGYNKAAKEARVNSIEEVQAMKDKFVAIGKARDEYIKSKTMEKEAAERAAREEAEAEMRRIQAEVDAAEEAQKKKEKIAEAERKRIAKGEEERAAAMLKHVEKATEDNVPAEVTRLGLQDEEHLHLLDLKQQEIAAEADKQAKITQLTEEGKNKRKLKNEEELALQLAVINGVEKALTAALDNKTARLNAEMQAELNKENLTEEQRAAIKKKYAKEQQKIDVKKAIINAAVGITKTFVEYGFTPAGIIAAAALAIESAVQIAAIKAQKFAKGGLITSGVHVTPDSRGDDTLIVAKKGEVVLNEKHQALLGGASTFRRIGVPGFAEGGVVGNLPQSQGVTVDMASFVDKIVEGFNDKKVILSLPELKTAENTFDLVTKASEL